MNNQKKLYLLVEQINLPMGLQAYLFFDIFSKSLLSPRLYLNKEVAFFDQITTM
jgi:hypothetical protein